MNPEDYSSNFSMIASYLFLNKYEAMRELESESLIIKYGLVELLFSLVFPLILFCFSIWVVVNIADDELPFALKVVVVVLVALLFLVVFLHRIKNGIFVLGANAKGIYFRKADDKEKFIFMSWNVVRDIDIYDDFYDARMLDIDTFIEDSIKFPKPCNGKCCSKDGKLTISLHLGMGRNARKIMNILDGLKKIG